MSLENELVRAEFRELAVAFERPDLRGVITPVLACGFGVHPLRWRDDTLVLAHSTRTSREARTALAAILDRPVDFQDVDRQALRAAILRHFHGDRGVNYNTFADARFLLDPASRPLLAREKVDELGGVELALREPLLGFLDIGFHSRVACLDGCSDFPPMVEAAAPKLPYRVQAGRPVLPAGTVLDPAARLLVGVSYRQEGLELKTGIKLDHVERLPYVLHPTEVQIVSLDVLGRLGIYLYDHVEQLLPGQTLSWSKDYYFLSMGQRFQRKLELRLRHFAVLARDLIAYGDDFDRWTPEELGRWLGLSADDP